MNPSLDEITSILNHSVRPDWENLRNSSMRDLELIVEKEENAFFFDRKSAKNYSTLINDLLLARSPVLRHQKFWELNRVPIGVCLLLRLLRPDRKGLFYTDTIYSLTAFLFGQVPTEILGDEVAWEIAYNFSVSEAHTVLSLVPLLSASNFPASKTFALHCCVCLNHCTVDLNYRPIEMIANFMLKASLVSDLMTKYKLPTSIKNKILDVYETTTRITRILSTPSGPTKEKRQKPN